MLTTFRPLPMPDFVSDRERCLFSEVVGIVEPYMQALGYGLRWQAEQHHDPACGADETVLRLDVVGYAEPDDAAGWERWFAFATDIYGALEPFFDSFRDSALEHDVWDLRLDLGPGGAS